MTPLHTIGSPHFINTEKCARMVPLKIDIDIVVGECASGWVGVC